MVFKYVLEVEVVIDEKNINLKYPNYLYNYNSIEEFADSLVFNDSYINNTKVQKDNLKKWGFSVRQKGKATIT
jgi:hypothetical protein